MAKSREELKRNLKNAQQLKRYRGLMGLASKEAAKRLKLSPAYYSLKENGRTKVQPEDLYHMRKLVLRWRNKEIVRLQRMIKELRAFK